MRTQHVTIEKNVHGAYVCTSLVYLGDETGTGLVHQTYYGYTKREALARFREYVQSVQNQNANN